MLMRFRPTNFWLMGHLILWGTDRRGRWGIFSNGGKWWHWRTWSYDFLIGLSKLYEMIQWILGLFRMMFVGVFVDVGFDCWCSGIFWDGFGAFIHLDLCGISWTSDFLGFFMFLRIFIWFVFGTWIWDFRIFLSWCCFHVFHLWLMVFIWNFISYLSFGLVGGCWCWIFYLGCCVLFVIFFQFGFCL